MAVNVIDSIAWDGVNSAATSAVALHLPAISSPRRDNAFQKQSGLHIVGGYAEIVRANIREIMIILVVYSQLDEPWLQGICNQHAVPNTRSLGMST